MELCLSSNDRTRVNTNRKRVFVDISASDFQDSLNVEFYDMHKYQLRLKEGTYKLFIFEKSRDTAKYDFGWWKDGVIIHETIGFTRNTNI